MKYLFTIIFFYFFFIGPRTVHFPILIIISKSYVPIQAAIVETKVFHSNFLEISVPDISSLYKVDEFHMPSNSVLYIFLIFNLFFMHINSALVTVFFIKSYKRRR